MSRQLGMHPGYYTGLGAVISRMQSEVLNAFTGAAGVVNAFLLKEKFDLAVDDPEKYEKRFGNGSKDA